MLMTFKIINIKRKHTDRISSVNPIQVVAWENHCYGHILMYSTLHTLHTTDSKIYNTFAKKEKSQCMLLKEKHRK